jgi:hypothetical protein
MSMGVSKLIEQFVAFNLLVINCLTFDLGNDMMQTPEYTFMCCSVIANLVLPIHSMKFFAPTPPARN